jgi:putative DNA primase/helicase
MSAHLDTGGGAVTFLTPQPENIPDDLKVLPWACWDPTPRPAGGYAKAPIHPLSGRMLRTNRPDEWLDYGTCLRHVADGRRTGFGLLLDGTTDLIGIDLDKVKVLFPQYPEVARLVSQYRKAGGYIEWSPSGTGLRLFCRGSMPFDGKRKGGIEIYRKGRFLTVTGRVLDREVTQ